jgi:ankyrin repeat protein
MLEEELARIVAFATDCARDGQTDLLDEFVRGGFPVDHPDSAGNTVLMLAAYHGHPATVAMLLAHGADPDRLNDRGQSPLAGALFKGEEEVVRALVAAGADPDVGTPSARESARMFGTEGLLENHP